MNAITPGGQGTASIQRLESVSARRLDRAALAAGAAERRTRLQEIEAAMDQACEAAVQRVVPPQTANRDAWDRRAWSIYTQKAVVQAAEHATTVSRLRREAAHLDHLAMCAS